MNKKQKIGLIIIGILAIGAIVISFFIGRMSNEMSAVITKEDFFVDIDGDGLEDYVLKAQFVLNKSGISENVMTEDIENP
jgi:hypothetical protein